MIGTKRILLSTSLVMLGYLSAPAYASLMTTGVSCSGQSTTVTGDAGYVKCSGAFSGNDQGKPSVVAAVAAEIKSDFGLTVGPSMDVTGSDKGDTSGTLMLPGLEMGDFVIALKAGDAFSLYEFDGGTTGIKWISFDTLGVGFINNGGTDVGQGLSGADLFTVTSVPEPATLALFAAGLAAIGFAVSRRRKSV